MKPGAKTAICYGEILWDILPDGPQPGGAPLNVAYHLTKLGVETKMISRVGKDLNGEGLLSLMENWGLSTSLVQVDQEHETSQVLAKIGKDNEVSYEIVYPVAWDFIAEPEQINTGNDAADYFIYGCLAARNPTSKDTLIKLLDTPAIKVFDINLRPPFYDKALLEILLAKADILKFNEAELDIVHDMFADPREKEREKINFIQQHFGIEEIIVTKGALGANYYKGDHTYHTGSSKIEVVDTIGSGDSFLATFIAYHSKGEHPEEIAKINSAVNRSLLEMQDLKTSQVSDAREKFDIIFTNPPFGAKVKVDRSIIYKEDGT
ncbi:MAG: carbohydrate kinase, partial [Pedobacter sp.]